MKSTLFSWIFSIYRTLKQATSKKIRSAVGDFFKAGIVLLLVVLVESYRFLHERWKNILEAVVAGIVVALILNRLL